MTCFSPTDPPEDLANRREAVLKEFEDLLKAGRVLHTIAREVMQSEGLSTYFGLRDALAYFCLAMERIERDRLLREVASGDGCRGDDSR